MTTPSNLTKRQWLALADGVARGRAMLSVSGAVGVDRVTLRQWFARPDMLDMLARRIGSPDALDADAFAVLFDGHLQDGERGTAYDLRQGFADALRETYPDWFAARDREAAAAAIEAKRQAEREKRRIEAEIEREEAAHDRMLGCLRADFWNLQTVVELHRREWLDGTPWELRRGLDTPDARRQYRCVKGLRWTCAGFGTYYAPTWSGARCRMQYALDDAAGDRLTAFHAIANDPRHARAWDEIEAEDVDGDGCRRDPFARRDKRLPTVEAAARALLEHVKAGGAFVGWKWKKPRKTANRNGSGR